MSDDLQVTWVECVQCARHFSYQRKPGPGRLRRFCSVECKEKRGDRRASQSACRTCGELYHPRFGGAGFCSLSCRQRPDLKKWKTPADRYAAKRNRRRARKLTAPYEEFSRSEIFERDGWKCGLCSQPVDRDLAHPDPMSASLDHIVPLAKGGSHTRSNVQCAHLICNSRKSDAWELPPRAA